MLHMYWFVSPISQTQPRHLPSALSTVYIFSYSYFFDLRRHFSVSDTTNTAHCSIHDISHKHMPVVLVRTVVVRYSVPKQASAGSVSEARGWPSATGWLQRRRHWASPRQKETETPLYLNVSFVDGHNWMAFMIILKYKTRTETLTFLHKSNKNKRIFKNFCNQTSGFDVA